MASRFLDSKEHQRNPSAGLIPERTHALGLKVENKKSSSKSSKLPATAAPPAYTSSPATHRKSAYQDQYEQQPAYNRAFDESSVASDFDQTIKSDIGVPQNYMAQDNGYYGRQDESQHAVYNSYSQSQRPAARVSSHILQRKHSQSPMIDQQVEETPRVSGRFDDLRTPFGELAVRSIENRTPTQGNHGSKKRSRSADRNPQPSIIFEERSSQMDDIEDDDEELPLPADNEPISDGDEQDDNRTISNSPRKNRRAQEPPAAQPAPKATKAANATPEEEIPATPDYTDAQLRKMTYVDLEKESWEKNDDKKNFQLVKPLRDNNTLKEKLEHYVFKEDEEPQLTFYEQMSPQEWEEGGDWFVEKFTELMNEIKTKRTQKKEITKKYEAEISAREKLVRGKSDALDREFKDMRVGGEGILRGKRV